MQHQLNIMEGIATTLATSALFQEFCGVDSTSASDCIYNFSTPDDIDWDDAEGFVVISNGSGWALNLRTLSSPPLYVESIDIRLWFEKKADPDLSDSENLWAFMQELQPIIQNVIADVHCPAQITLGDNSPMISEKENNRQSMVLEVALEAPRAEATK